MDQTPNIQLPYIAAAQAQKHVTHNEALRILDAIVQIAVLDRDLANPPASPNDGARYIVAASPAGAWLGKSGQIAAWQDGAWAFYAPAEGWIAWVADEDVLIAWSGTDWVSISAAASVNPVPLVGVNTTADTTNRLAVAASASLFSHAGAGHQMKLDKATATDTASLLIQTGFSGRAEIGTTGNDDLSVKVSPNGTTWSTSVIVKNDTGAVLLGGTAPLAGERLLVTSKPSVSGQPSILVVGDSNTERVEVRSPLGPGFQGKGYSGTSAAPGASANNQTLFQLTGSGHTGADFMQLSPAFCWIKASETWTTAAQGAYWAFWTTPTGSPSSSRQERLRIEGDGTVRAGVDNAQSLGSSAFRWSQVWAANGTIQTSDARDKDVVARLDDKKAAAVVDAVNPVMFRWKVGGYEFVPSATQTEDIDGVALPKMEAKPVAGRRLHGGFLAQDVKAAMDTGGLEFGAWGLDDKADAASRQWLRPDQLIPLLWSALKATRADLAALRSRVKA